MFMLIVRAVADDASRTRAKNMYHSVHTKSLLRLNKRQIFFYFLTCAFIDIWERNGQGCKEIVTLGLEINKAKA